MILTVHPGHVIFLEDEHEVQLKILKTLLVEVLLWYTEHFLHFYKAVELGIACHSVQPGMRGVLFIKINNCILKYSHILSFHLSLFHLFIYFPWEKQKQGIWHNFTLSEGTF